jgi:putative PIN family toxin of toxin-antitoxin system
VIVAVLDTNVLASGFLRRNPASTVVQIVDAWRAFRYRLVVSEHILGELARTFQDPYFRRFLRDAEIVAALALLRRQATIATATTVVVGIASHPEDDLVLATAVSAMADYLVTGDRQLRGLGVYRGVAILSPRAFLDVLGP